MPKGGPVVDSHFDELSGSVFINNTSYSGCDIKVVVNLYDQGVGIQKQIKDLQDQLKKQQQELVEIQQDVSIQDGITANKKFGTPGWLEATGRLRKLARRDRLRARLNLLLDFEPYLSQIDVELL